ncbi:MAG: helix-turn-helix domain-containing protein [Candidatus Marinimicrobia bacterium]|nr:helix-turn-helix domain-containing protein [Candidatus Neomarinimicrobiota bacterium]MCF7904278.1 helix-turn-helix domain-containing protein [Candidatus Neomarinimicrobiota bacterium]
MDISHLHTDTAILEELGRRLARMRVRYNLTQAILAEQAGISKPTLERIEAGRDAQVSSLIRILRALDILDVLDSLIPAAKASPMERLKTGGKKRKRASASPKQTKASKPWSWRDEV